MILAKIRDFCKNNDFGRKFPVLKITVGMIVGSCEMICGGRGEIDRHWKMEDDLDDVSVPPCKYYIPDLPQP